MSDAEPPQGNGVDFGQIRHDLRSPLGQILGYGELLREEAQERGVPELLADLSRIERAARAALEVVEKQLPARMAGAVAPKLVPTPSPFARVEPEPRTRQAMFLDEEKEARAEILVVDDNELNRDMLSRRLTSRGYSVVVAGGGEEAIDLLSRRSFDAVLLDVMMPRVSGLDVLRHIRGRWSESELPVIMATARDATSDIVEALRLGANDYVTKPLDFAVTLARLQTHLTLKSQKDEIGRLAQGLERRSAFIQQVFGRYLSDEIVEALLDDPKGLRFGGELRQVTILMADLRGFTTLADALGPEQVVGVLNRYLGRMADIILLYRGTIDEFVGDAILALFGAPLAREDDARRAAACALAMQLGIDALNREFAFEGLPHIEMGVAVHTGQVVVGNIGSERRAKYGVVGTPVNHTGRIESFTVGGQILVSDATLGQVGSDVTVGERLAIDAKGAREPLLVHELRGIAGDVNLSLPWREDRPVRLGHAIPVTYNVVEEKRVEAEAFAGRLVALSVQGALMQSERGLRPLSNVKLRPASDGPEAMGDVYAKVIGTRGPELYLRFTSMSPGAEEWIRDSVAHASR